MESYRNIRLSIVFVTIATMIVAFFWGHSFMAPRVVRMFFVCLMILSMAVFPYRFIRENDFDKFSNFLLRLILILGVIAIIRSVFNENYDMYAFGNKWATLFGNEMAALLFVPPLFTYLSTKPLSVFLLSKINYQYMFWGALCFLWHKYPLAHLVICLSVFFPYVKRQYKILIGFAVLQALLGASDKYDSVRIFYLLLLFGLTAYVLVYKIKKINIIRFFCITCLVLPFFLFIPILFKSNVYNQTFFEKIQTYIIDNTGKRDLAADTRSFLYREMALDLAKSESWVWGKGAYAHYYSEWFDEGRNGKHGRMGIEVVFLNFLMHGGIVYVFLYNLLLVYAIYKGLWKSNNKFIQCCAVVITGWFLCGFIGDLLGCRYYHMFFYILLGCCLSKRFLSMNDEQIVLLFKGNSII